MTSDAIKYFLTCQNVGVTLDENGEKVLVTEDIRNGNGRTVKSRYVTENRVDHLAEPIDAIYWIMKDDTLPPVTKIENPDLATIYGLTLATKRSTAENIVGNVDLDKLVIEPFANPFRSYPLGEDYAAFRELFASGKDCYILNTGFFNGNKVTPADTLGSIEKIVEGSAEFVPFGTLEGVSYLPNENHPLNFDDVEYQARLKARLADRLTFVKEKQTADEGYNALPENVEGILSDFIGKI
jgi:phosphoenolpyruvate carboxykinase (ATP)